MAIDITTTSGISSLVDAYKATEVQRQLYPLSTKKTSYQNVSSAYGVMSSKLDTLQSVLSSLKTTTSSSVFNTKAATSSNTAFATASATGSASSSSYVMRVNRLAKNDSLLSANKTSEDNSTITAGDYKFNVKVGDVQKDLTVTIGTDNSYKTVMQSIRDAVNADDELSDVISASVFSPTTSTSKLSFTSKTSGSDNAIELTDTDSLLSKLGITGSRTPLMSGDGGGFVNTLDNLDSEIVFNNITVTRGSNTISDLVDGVTFNLKNQMVASDSDVNISVANDITQAKSKIESFVSSFNSIYGYLKTNSTSSKDTRGTLYGDSSTTTLLSNLGRMAYSQVSGINTGELSLLSQIGISFDSTNGLSISDSSALTTKLTEVPEQVANLFNSTNGVASKLYELVNPYLGSTGYLANRQSSISTNVTSLTDRITSVQARIDKSAESLRSQYEQLQVQLLTLINTQGVYNANL